MQDNEARQKSVSRRVPSQLNTELEERRCGEMFVFIMEEYHA